MSWDVEAFREKVESQHEFPGKYSFKFIVPKESKDELLSILPESEISFKKSSGDKYVSITAVALVLNSQGVIDVYYAANKVKGCMAL
ncbi:MAG: DUF493 domain-containing protein [Cyclobacteriaceae bacterium]